jgi:hypothetical protein
MSETNKKNPKMSELLENFQNLSTGEQTELIASFKRIESGELTDEQLEGVVGGRMRYFSDTYNPMHEIDHRPIGR